MTKEKWQRQKLQLRSSLLILTSFKLSFEFQDMIEKFSLGGFCAHIGFRTQRQSKVIHPKRYKHLIKSSSHKDFNPEFSIRFKICCKVHGITKPFDSGRKDSTTNLFILGKLWKIMGASRKGSHDFQNICSSVWKGWELTDSVHVRQPC